MWFRQYLPNEDNQIVRAASLPEPADLLRDVRKINRSLGLWEHPLSGIGIHARSADSIFTLEFEEIVAPKAEDPVAVNDFVLRVRIALLHAMPAYPVHWLKYPRAFREVYRRAPYRLLVIEEYEKFLTEVLELKPSDELDRELKNYSPIATASGLVESFLSNLFDLYMAEYHYEKAEGVMRTLNSRGMLRGGQVSEFYRKTHRMKEGIEFVEQTIPMCRARGSREAEFKLALQTMKHQHEHMRPFKPRPVPKKRTPDGKVMRYERKKS